MSIKTKISKKQAKELVSQFLQNSNYISYKSSTNFYYSFTDKKASVDIKIYEFDKKYFLEIITLS